MYGIARRVCIAASVVLAAPAFAQGPRVTLQVDDISPRFLTFYDAAVGEPDAARRFALWKQHYDFATLPPVPQADSMARAMLDAAEAEAPALVETAIREMLGAS